MRPGALPAEPWVGAILCGGRSRRMGRDKALVVVDGEPMVRRVARALHQAGATRVHTVGGDRDALRAATEGVSDRAGGAVAALADGWPGEGPLGGIVTALEAATADLVLVVACDLVAPSPGTMAATVAALAGAPEADAAVPVRSAAAPRGRPGDGGGAPRPGAVVPGPIPPEAGSPEWLHAAWRRAAAAPLAARLAAGERAVHRAVGAAALTVLAVAGLDPASLADADTPADITRRGQ
jgi:molybdopterin-guanine dinucleotide biosynthesis protein A